MKVQQLVQRLPECETCYLSLGFKCACPFPSKLSGATAETIAALHVTSFIRHEDQYPSHMASCTSVNGSAANRPRSGGPTRWNPTREQIGVLETLYEGGVRTPNAQQIEQITAALGQHGKIEGKNVFYWFQNHKARERQRQKRSILTLGENNSSLPTTPLQEEVRRDSSNTSRKRRCRSWSLGSEEGDSVSHRTLELFPLQPEGRYR